MMNMGDSIAEFELPSPMGHTWQRVLDTSLPSPNDVAPAGEGVDIDGGNYIVNSHSIVLLASVAVTKSPKLRAK
jgi:isoamylase